MKKTSRETSAPDFGSAGVSVASVPGSDAAVLTKDALTFVAALERAFGHRRLALLDARQRRQKDFDAGNLPDFPAHTARVRDGDWTIAPVPDELRDRRVEMTGPVERKMIINGLNSGANVFMADFEDSNSPTWRNCVDGQANLMDAVRGTISLETDGKSYALSGKPAVLFVRPRGLHLHERHMRVDDRPVSASFFDFGLYFHHNARALVEKGSAPYFYLPKLESHLEARLWNDVFLFAQERCGLARGTTKATVLVETLPAVFEMDEILHELREHSAGLNCGRWDYIFSFIKKLNAHKAFMLPERARVTMDVPFMQAYVDLLVQTCHRRGAHAMGGMSAHIPNKNDPDATARALEKVRQDKLREVERGHDGTWVAHPGLIAVAREVFDAWMPEPNQIDRDRPRASRVVHPSHLLATPTPVVTEDGVRTNLRVGTAYLAAWISGRGCVPIDALMEDAATAEICRAQLWQWIRHGARTEEGRDVTLGWCEGILDALRPADLGCEAPAAQKAKALMRRLIAPHEFVDFLTLPAYDLLD